MMTNLRLKSPSCRASIFERLLSYILNQINNFIMVLIESIGQKTKIRDSKWRPRGQKCENTRRKETQENEISRLMQNASKISRLERKFPRPWIFQVPFATPNLTLVIAIASHNFLTNFGCTLFAPGVLCESSSDLEITKKSHNWKF